MLLFSVTDLCSTDALSIFLVLRPLLLLAGGQRLQQTVFGADLSRLCCRYTQALESLWLDGAGWVTELS
jgi:hypothetical protein